ncbi:hypothetical protein K4F84_14870 [Phaeobacter inhibens]|uniref:hypothetical protein n=2 Tax=Phaeobacter inhibens TaxID=221822 RepID=UPI0021A40D41|nr:hypothetical protein [Phaeobacter inhibens]UWR52465.1 hypothetical protein K4F84_14870 [Phaeobacter inhibens]UWR68033.1 hypothetical protein K4K95_15070 [Phaeobacter inhibens]
MLRLIETEQVADMEAIIRSYLGEANEICRQRFEDTIEPDFPTERVDALAADPEMAEASDNLTRGRAKAMSLT